MYVAATVTLTDSAQGIKSLVEAAIGASLPQDRCSEVLLQVAGDSTGVVSVGDANLSGSRRACQLLPYDSRQYRGIVDVKWLYALSSSSGDKLNVELVAA